MTLRFSRRYGLCDVKKIQLENIDTALFNRLWNVIRDREYVTIMDDINGIVEKIYDGLGESYRWPEDRFIANHNLEHLHNKLMCREWYVMYDVIEMYIEFQKYQHQREELECAFNKILEEECSAYRVIGGLVVPITDEESIKALKKSLETPFDATNQHMSKALMLYSDRQNPDYENSIKESISAVEAMCCVITGAKGGEATLGKMLKKLEDKGIHIHGSLKSAFSQLYGFTSDENGIRHGGEDFKDASSEDAYFMLISCSAFINYLKVKYSKIK